MTVADDLRAAKELISDPKRWTQRAYARDSAGFGLHYGTSVGAVCWCSAGAMEKVTGLRSITLAGAEYLDAAAKTLGHHSLEKLNDNTDHPTVMRMFDLAIEAAEREGV